MDRGLKGALFGSGGHVREAIVESDVQGPDCRHVALRERVPAGGRKVWARLHRRAPWRHPRGHQGLGKRQRRRSRFRSVHVRGPLRVETPQPVASLRLLHCRYRTVL